MALKSAAPRLLLPEMQKPTVFSRPAILRLFEVAFPALLVLILVTPLQAQDVATIRPNPATMALVIGQVQAVEIVLENAQDVYGIDIRASFDPAKVEIIDADPTKHGTQVVTGAFPIPDFVALNSADNAAGTLRYVVTQVNPTPPATGSGVAFSFQLRARSAGQSALTLTLVEMSDRDGMLLAVTPESATIDVAGGAPAVPTGIVLQTATAEPTANTSPVASVPPLTLTSEDPSINPTLASNTITTATSVAMAVASPVTPQPIVAPQEPFVSSNTPSAAEPPAPTTALIGAASGVTDSLTESTDSPPVDVTRVTAATEVAVGSTAMVGSITAPDQLTVIGENAGRPVTPNEPLAAPDSPQNGATTLLITTLIIAVASLATAVALWVRRR